LPAKNAGKIAATCGTNLATLDQRSAGKEKTRSMSHSTPRPRIARKLLTASIGVATLSYVASATSCGSSPDHPTTQDAASEERVVGNLAPLPTDAQGLPTDAQPPNDALQVQEIVVGNLVGIPIDASADMASDTSSDQAAETATDSAPDDAPQDVRSEFIIGNLAPPPQDH
jgi:hypothetical protein